MLKAVIHVNFDDPEKQGHGLRNVRNLLNDAEGEATVEVVCHGAGLFLLVKDRSRHAEEVAELMQQGVRFAACANTMREKSVGKDLLLPGVVTIPSGIGEIIRKQQEGYSYFKP